MSNFTIENLYQNSVRLAPWRRNQTNNYNRRLINIIPYVMTKSVLFQFVMQGLTQRNVIHNINLLFEGIEIVKELPKADTEFDKYKHHKPSGNAYAIDYIKHDYKGETYFIKKPNLRKNTVLVRCTCKDAYFTQSHWNFVNNCWFGPKAKPYHRLTPAPPIGMPYRNPLHIPLLCKHELQAAQMLQSSGFTSNR